MYLSLIRSWAIRKQRGECMMMPLRHYLRTATNQKTRENSFFLLTFKLHLCINLPVRVLVRRASEGKLGGLWHRLLNIILSCMCGRMASQRECVHILKDER